MAILETSQATSLEQALAAIRPAVRREQAYVVGGTDYPVKLNQNESPFDLPEELKRELAGAFAEVAANRYPTEQPDRLRHALAEHLGHPTDGLLIGNGSNELMYTLGLVLIGAGTPVVLPRPMFSLYEKIVRLHEGALTTVAPRPDLSFDTEGLLDAVRCEQPALVVLTTPNNPTALAMEPDAVEAIVAEAPGIVVVDEAYVEFNEAGSAFPLLARYPNLLLLRTFSKAYGLAGLRLGYLIGHPDVIREFGKARLPFMVDRMAEQTALALLARPALIRERIEAMLASRADLAHALAAMDGVEVLPSRTNFLLFRTPQEPEAIMTRLAERGVLVRNMRGYPELAGCIRVNAGTPAENKAFLAALESALHEPPRASE